ncbi:hypothetical protein ACN28T_00215 [Melittangium boletus]
MSAVVAQAAMNFVTGSGIASRTSSVTTVARAACMTTRMLTIAPSAFSNSASTGLLLSAMASM